ncbi:thiamine-monophosphate kinase [Friedmanniella endophytica]|uniref:Thiamine-monophosphate kinase n=1 Tax=Microlunatus kandeliicorticis TaxID=1759536 RepID=A0A7W3IUE9_9ACTN|nr:thiamine-phosphate kinase [Microlunatus kandeliicorticis]MBA8795442.1 thiamine-monophosphate kinase [Microlunatus kandeliicorticis]
MQTERRPPRGSDDPAAETLGTTGEFALISAITADLEPELAAAVGGRVLLGPGDDGAVLLADGPVVSSIDCLVEGVHFRTDWSEALDVGRKAVAVNLADLEAMGAAPVGVLVGFTAPAELPTRWALDFAAGVRQECRTAGAALLGGDTTRGPVIMIAVTALGTLPGEAITRDNARPGDVVAVCGRLGWAAAGLAVLGRGFRSPRAVVEAQRVPAVPYGQGRAAAAAGAHAMIDISDGLLADLGHVARASKVIIDLDPAAFAVPDPLRAVAAATGSDPLTLILTGGEDHALAAAFSAEDVPEGWTVVGRVLRPDAAEGRVTVDGREWEGARGWDHFRR